MIKKKIITFFFLLISLTACTQNVGCGIGVASVGTSGNNIAATEIIADSETGILGSVNVGTNFRL